MLQEAELSTGGLSMPNRSCGALFVVLLSAATIGHAQTAGFIYARPTNVPPTSSPEGAVRDNINYLQGPDPILLSPGGDIVILTNAGQCCDGHWEAIFSLLYPRSGAPPQFTPIWASNNWGNDLSRNEHEVGFPSAVYYNGQWRISYTATFWCTANPGNPACVALCDAQGRCDSRVGRVDLPNLTTQASPVQVTNTWVPPSDPACSVLGTCQDRPKGLEPSLVIQPDGQLYLYQTKDETSTCASKRIRNRVNSDLTIATPEQCLVFNGMTNNVPGFMDVARGADGAMYMLAVPEGTWSIQEWKSIAEMGYPLGLYWRDTGRRWSQPPGPVPGFPDDPPPAPARFYAVWDPAYLTDPTGLIVEPKVVVAQLAHGTTIENTLQVTLGNWWLYYWADAGANLPPNFGASIPLAAAPLPTVHDFVWVDDHLPAGAHTDFDLGNHFLWDYVQKAGGVQGHTRNGGYAAMRQQYFYDATQTMAVQTGDSLISYVLLNPVNPPRELMLQWKVGSGDQQWEHRAFWGENLIAWGTTGTASRYSMGALPPLGKWIRLEVPANLVGMAGATANGMAFTLYGGQAWFDRSGKVTPMSFYTLTPCRIIDTRNPNGPYGGPALAANVARTFTIAGQCAVPQSAKALAINVTVSGSSAAGVILVYPAAVPTPSASTINYKQGQTRANNAITTLDLNGRIAVVPFQPTGSVHFILDVNGYFQ
jgi:hypothetical protein